MTSIHRVPVSWAGPQVVGLAANILHFEGSDNPAPPIAALRTAYLGLASLLPTGVQISFPTSGDTINDTTGELVGTWSAGAQPAVMGTAPATAAAGAGACITWTTQKIVPSTKVGGKPKRLRGRTFIVPVTTLAYDTSGHYGTTTLDQLNTFAQAMQTMGGFAIWHRPPKGASSGGDSGPVLGHRISNKVAFLSSRRD